MKIYKTFLQSIDRCMSFILPDHYFVDWYNEFGKEKMNFLQSKTSIPVDDDLLDALDYNIFALSKAAETQDEDIIAATLADSICDMEKIVRAYEN